MEWDYRGNLIKTVGGTITTYYRYDSNGNRVRKIAHKTGAITEERIYIGNYEVYRKTVNGTLDSERESSFISDDTKRIAIVDTRNVPTPVEVTIRYQYDNHLGSACLELDSSGAIISYEEYHPFGTTSYRAGRNATETGLKRYKYVGKERDEETGLYYYGARYYAAWLCRFVSVDPLQFKYPELTPFQYASNRPVTGIDLDGLEFYRKDETVIKLGISSINWNTDNISESLKRSISRPIYYKKAKYDSLQSNSVSLDIVIKEFNVDRYLQAYHYEQSVTGYANKNSNTLSSTTYDSTPLTKNWVVDKRYNPQTSNNWWFNSGRGAKASALFTVVIQSIKLAEVLNNNEHISTDVTKAINQLDRMFQAIDLFEQAVNKEYIPQEISKSHDFKYFRKDVINYIFSGEVPDSGIFNFQMNGEWKEIHDYKGMIKEIGTNIYNDKANKYKPYTIK
jgi:RHS repeat-associated protein